MRSSKIIHLVALCGATTLLVAGPASGQDAHGGRGDVRVEGARLFRDGHLWVPHGFYQIAFEVAPANLAKSDHPFWTTAFQNYSPSDYREMRAAGADSVRLQISQAAADPRSPIFDVDFLEKAMGAVRAARAAGLTVIVSVQDESHVPGDTPIDLPDEGTRRVWQQIAPRFSGDAGVMFELLNEPRPQPNPVNWRKWAEAMNKTAETIRQAGARNVLVADGLGVGQVIDGAPLLQDPQVVYASHPYALKAFGQTSQAWDAKFGNFSRRAPVIISEWLSGGYYCDDDTAQSTVQFIKYLDAHQIGLEMGIWDWAPKGFGSVRQGFPDAQFSRYRNLSCHQPFFGSGQVIEKWYKTGVPANSPE